MDLKEVSGALGMLNIDPHLSATLLRPLLMNSVASEHAITAQYMANFRRRCEIFYATNPNYVKLSIEDGLKLTKNSRISSLEENTLLPPNINSNYRAMFATIMQSGTHACKALAYLKN